MSEYDLQKYAQQIDAENLTIGKMYFKKYFWFCRIA
jgi:hypothetical protein